MQEIHNKLTLCFILSFLGSVCVCVGVHFHFHSKLIKLIKLITYRSVFIQLYGQL